MTMNDLTASALSKIKNAERAKKKEVVIMPISTQMVKVFEILKAEKYIEDFKAQEDARGGSAKIILSHSINDIGAIKPRFPVKVDNFEKFETRYLPAVNFGRLIVSTPKGMLTHLQAKEQNIGGVLIAYVY